MEGSRVVGMHVSSSARPGAWPPRVTGVPGVVVMARAVPRNPRRPLGFFLAAMPPLWSADESKCERGVVTARRFV